MRNYRETWQFICTVIKQVTDLLNTLFCTAEIYKGQDLECTTLKGCGGASLVAQWLIIRLPVQRTRVRALDREDPTCRGATKPVRHNY